MLNNSLYFIMGMLLTIPCMAMHTEKPAEERRQTVRITNRSPQPVKIYSELMFRQTWLPKKQEPAQEEPKGLIACSVAYLMSAWSSEPTTTSTMDGNSEEPWGILAPHENTEFKLLFTRTQQHDNSFTFRKKAWVNLFAPTDMKMSMDSKLSSCILGKNPVEEYIITENADGKLTINKVDSL